MMRLNLARGMQTRWFATKEKMKVINSLDEQLLNEDIKHRSHPGIIKPRTIETPKWLLKSVESVLEDIEIKPKVLQESGKRLAAHLHGRHLPIEMNKLKEKVTVVKSILAEKKIIEENADNDEEIIRLPEAQKLLYQHVYQWAPIRYQKHTCLSYLATRSIPEYSTVYRVLNEIKHVDPEFKPKTLFDFGSGTGTVLWAASQHWPTLEEYLCVDVSSDMNDLSEALIKNAEPAIKNVYYRQFFPASPVPSYDIVVSAYSFFELPDLKTRIETLGRLWRKTNNYLVIIEQGTNAGFRAVKDARDFVLHYIDRRKSERVSAHVVAPCPHDFSCPRFATDDTPCNFVSRYYTLPIGQNSRLLKEIYSYVILKKGNRPETDKQWPRIVRPTLKRSMHCICRMCTASGKLREEIFTKWKNGRNTYRCARVSEWGDRLPFEIEKNEETD